MEYFSISADVQILNQVRLLKYPWNEKSFRKSSIQPLKCFSKH